jgi:hypothetical protein
MRRTVIEQVGCYDPARLHAEDYDLWWRISLHTTLANLPEPLVAHRLQPNSISHRHKAVQKQTTLQIMQAIIGRLLDRPVSRLEATRLYQAIWHEPFNARSEIWQAVDLMQNLHQIYIAQTYLSPLDKRLITLDLAERIAYLALKNIKFFPLTSLQIMLYATKLMPLWLTSQRTSAHLKYILKKCVSALAPGRRELVTDKSLF